MCGSNRTCGVCDTIFDWIAKILWRNCLGSNSGGFFELFVSGIKDIDLEIQTLYNKNIKKVRFLIRKGDDFMPLVVQDIIYEFTKEIKKSYKKIALFIGRNLRGTTYFYLNEKASNVVTAVTATCLLEYSARATQRRVQKHPYTFSPTMCSLKLQSFYYFLFKCCHI